MGGFNPNAGSFEHPFDRSAAMVPNMESPEARMDRMQMLIEQQQHQIQQLTEMLRQQRQPVAPIRVAYAANRGRSAVGNIFDDPNMRATTDGDIWMRQVRNPLSGNWETREARPLLQVSETARNARYERVREMRQYAYARNNTEFARQREKTRETAAFAMGPETYFNVNGARDRLFAPMTSGTDIAFQSSILRAGGAEYISPSGNYAVLPMKGPRTGAGREDPVQAELKNHYASQMDGGALESRFDHLRGGESADRVFAMLDSRRSRWGNRPGDRYGDLAWARSQFEFLDKGRWQDEQMRNNRESIGDAPTLHTESVPLSGDPFQQIMIRTPQELDPYGKEGHVLLQPNSHQKFWDSKSIQYAKDAGIDFVIDKWPDGRARGVRIKFTKPGTFNVAGRQIYVGKQANENRAAVENERSAKRPLSERVLKFQQAPTKFHITSEGQGMETIDVTRLQPGGSVDGQHGVRIVRDRDGTYRVQHYEPGSYSVNVRWNGDTQRPFGKMLVR